MSLALAVIAAFGEYKKGDHITDPAAIAEVSESPDARHTVRCVLPDAVEAPAKKGKATA